MTRYLDIAEKLSVRDTTLSRWCHGHRFPNRVSMLRIEEILGWPVSEQMHAFNLSTGENKTLYGTRFKEFLRDKHGVEDTRL